MERLKNMKETLMSSIQGQLSHLDQVDTKELGEVVDMVKDLSEAIYYCSITEAMEGKDNKHGNTYYYTERFYPMEYYRDMDRNYGKMYYGEGSRNTSSGGAMSGRNVSYYGERGMSNSYPMEIRDSREGRSPMSRRMYMESKELHQDKAKQMQELEKYMRELSDDITEMIEGASPEEKQLLQQKVATLAAKIK